MSGVVVDSSAMVAILTGEPGQRWLSGELDGSGYPILCVGNDFMRTDVTVLSPSGRD